MTAAILAAALVLTGLYAYFVLYLFTVALIRRRRYRKSAAAEAAVHAEIADAIVQYASGNHDQLRLRAFAAKHRRQLEECLMQFYASLSGEGRDRLAELALDLTLVHQWCQETASRSVAQRRTALSRLTLVAAYEPARRIASEFLVKGLQDPDHEARLEAARSLVHSSHLPQVVEVFRLAVRQQLLVRAILTEDLRPFALGLCETAIPEALQSDDPARISAALEMVLAWERALPLPDLTPLFSHADPCVRVLALRALPLASATMPALDALVRAIFDPLDEVAAAAAASAGRLKLTAALAPLSQALRKGRVDLARAAAAALAQLPPRGWETLEELSQHSNPITASAAWEALERARKTERGETR
jgi:hypothetical protein